MTNSVIYHILIYLNIMSLIIGYIIGKFLYKTETQSSYLKSNKKNNSLEDKVSGVTIDDKKYVVAIDTKGIEKKFDNISTTKESEDNISEAVNKLKNMKG